MSTKIKIKGLPAGYQSLITNGRHSLVGDEPLSSKGTDLGFSPEDLLLSALAACKVSTVRFIARKKGWELRDVDAQLELSVQRHADRSLSSRVQIAIQIEGDLSAGQRAELLREADNCYVHRLLNGSWDIAAAVENLPSEHSQTPA
jgi:putative redox protein